MSHEEITQPPGDDRRAIETAREIPFFDSYDIGTGKLSLRSATHFPMEILDFAGKYPLRILNASGSELSLLPKEFAQLDRLQIALFSDNKFEEVPKVFGECPNLSIIALKSNKISVWDENALPAKTRWLMLTGNSIERIPSSIGDLRDLQKLALAGNRIETLPDELAKCENLELIRIAANNLTSPPPEWVFKHKKLAWYGDSGNPFCAGGGEQEPLIKTIKHEDLSYSESDLIGESPSSRVYRGVLSKTGEPVAVKVFKGGLTSDGYPRDDMRASIRAGSHRGLIRIIGQLSEHAEGKEGIVLSLVPPEYKKLGHPPTFETCTRDTFSSETLFSEEYILNALCDISSACEHLHGRKLMHGDIYAHNILSRADGRSLLGDFGAASLYDSSGGDARERLDVRAFGCLIEDLLSRTVHTFNPALKEKLRKMERACKNPDVEKRPLFEEICREISSFAP